jgi:hypothetical protein
METSRDAKDKFDPEKILVDNDDILADLISKGVSSRKKFDFDFRLVLKSVADCKYVRENYRKKIRNPCVRNVYDCK